MPLNIYKGSSVPAPNGTQMLDQYGEHIETLYETGSRPLTAVGGTANVVTATMAIDVTAAGLVDGLCVSITWVASNTSNVTLAINGGAAIPVVDARGLALQAGTLANGLTSVLRYTAGQWRIISGFGADTAGGGPIYQAFTASGTWTRPTGYDPDTSVLIECWGGGGGGGPGSGVLNATGGGGGGYNKRLMRIADLPSSVSVTIGAGGASGAAGGATSFGSILSAFGGGPGSSSGNLGGGGGGEVAAGVNGTGGIVGGANSTATTVVPNALTVFGGGGGGGISGSVPPTQGGSAVYGGGGGGSRNNFGASVGGASINGGNGANAPTSGNGNAGFAPGGGGSGAGALGGVGGAGARGECRIRILG